MLPSTPATMPVRSPAPPKPKRRRSSASASESKPAPTLRRTRRKRPRRVLVTGAGGLVGRLAVGRLQAQGWHVVALSRQPAPAPSPPGTVHLTTELASEGWERWCEGCQAAIHLVGAVRPADGAAGFDRVHRQAASRVVEACGRLGIKRLVAVSAAGARSDAPTELLRSKWAAEEVVRACRASWTIVRPSLIFGPGDRFSSALARLARWFPLVPLPGGPRALFQPIAAEDIADIVVAALEQPAAEGGIFEVGGPERLTLDAMMRRTLRALRLRRLLVRVPLRLVLPAVRIAERTPSPLLTGDELTMLLQGSTADMAAASLVFDLPKRRFEGPVWLR